MTISQAPACQVLDYEVEIGLVIGRDIPVGTEITESNLADFIAGLVVTNDISARDVQLTQTQFYEAKSYPTFTPVGPALVLLDADELNRFGDLRLEFGSTAKYAKTPLVHGDMIYPPLQALQSLAGSSPCGRRPGHHRHAGRHRTGCTTQAHRDHRLAAAARR